MNNTLILPKTINVLDKGFVTLLNVSSFNSEGVSDRDPAQCARTSFNNFKTSKTEQQDLNLVNYLYENQHMTPFEMIELWFEVKLPIFLARQFVRHRTASINEISGRYVKLPSDWYIPEIVGAKPTNGAKQGQENTLDEHAQKAFKQLLNDDCLVSYARYESMLEAGVAPEHARFFLHTNHYTQWIWKMNLRNFMHFLQLRLNSHAQVEARIYASAMHDLVQEHLPHLISLINVSDK